MGKRGPLPRDNVRELRGLPAARRPPPAAPLPSKAPDPPPHLAGEALSEWHRVAPLMLERGWVDEVDRAALALYCQSWSQSVQVERDLQAAMTAATDAGRPASDAMVDVSGRSGLPRRAMLMQLAAQLRRETAQHLAALGISPTARARLPEASRQSDLPGFEADPGPTRFFR